MKISIRKHVYSNLGNIQMVERVVELPFVPFVGLLLFDGEWEETIERVEYDLEKQECFAYFSTAESIRGWKIVERG